MELTSLPELFSEKFNGRAMKLLRGVPFLISDVLAFIASDEEYVDERPATTRSGRAVKRRAEIDFSLF